MAATPRRVYKRRETITALPLYYSGQLQKKYTGEKDFKNFYGELRGSTIFLYRDEMHDTYSEKLDLQMLKSMAMDSSYQNNRSTIYTLTLSNEEVQLKVDNPNTGEEWRGFIMTVATKEIPSKLQLLPGQILRLEEVLSEEKKRQAPRPPLPPTTDHIHPSSGDTYDDALSGIPPCFFPVSRQKAENMLKDNTKYGSIILRPSTDNTNYAITLRQDHPSGPVMKNYKVLSIDTGFVIELDAPVTVPSLEAVLDHFLKATEFRLHPYLVPQPYDTCIDLPPALHCFPPKMVPQARVAPMIHTKSATGSTPPSFPKPPLPIKATEAGNKYQGAYEVSTPRPQT
ncbi:signal-transducing adaptor protein 1 [Coregonus clupeaformis]|uniref:signal-transducing adaptor protein 1 n=1 Tax=Coregonus clupeaformis TaxID=59861 RepID=UPI001BDF9995|nr:signal-transducing adaptor protein 1 [Coregonus clupeaformis]